jgi:hypothetical protein
MISFFGVFVLVSLVYSLDVGVGIYDITSACAEIGFIGYGNPSQFGEPEWPVAAARS